MRTGILLICLVMLAACETAVYNPRPRAYPRVVYPERVYQAFQKAGCPFHFEYPVYATVKQDLRFFDEAAPSECWYNIEFPDFNGKVHFSYYPIRGEADFNRLRGDAFEMVDWHNKKASYIEEKLISLPNGTTGFVFDIEGPAASPFQFFLTDSTQHFLRGALYFDTAVNPDSLAPVLDFVRKDILHMIEHFEWKK
jgi:gliding motility-associated lipoprotein GldD